MSRFRELIVLLSCFRRSRLRRRAPPIPFQTRNPNVSNPYEVCILCRIVVVVVVDAVVGKSQVREPSRFSTSKRFQQKDEVVAWFGEDFRLHNLKQRSDLLDSLQHSRSSPTMERSGARPSRQRAVRARWMGDAQEYSVEMLISLGEKEIVSTCSPVGPSVRLSDRLSFQYEIREANERVGTARRGRPTCAAQRGAASVSSDRQYKATNTHGR